MSAFRLTLVRAGRELSLTRDVDYFLQPLPGVGMNSLVSVSPRAGILNTI